ncbi:Hypothetical predicted protein [Mytilus galloprovincialis]|nr:Hypothetical predicted protein [Mytilus galloprovincialis]
MMSGKRGEDPKKIVSKLIRHGANVNICDTSGETVLSIFCEQGSNIEIGDLLLNSAADPSKGYCIQHVMENRRFSVNDSDCINFIRRLLRNGADANKFKNGKSNVIEATKKGYRLLVEKMIKYGADVNFYDSTHQIALHHACGLEKSKGRDDLVHLLVQHGSKLNVLSTRGEKGIDILLNKILEENDTIEDDESNGCSRLEYDMKLFNYLVRAGCYLLPSATSKTQISHAQGRATTGANKSILLTLINIGLFKTAEYLILSGWNIEQEVWFNNFDVSSLQLSDVEIKYTKRKQRDVEIRKSEFKAFLDGLDKGPKSLSIICRKSIRQQLLLAAEDSEIESRVNLLPIPAKMKCFLGLSDYAQDKEVIQLELNRSVRPHTSVSSDLVQAFLLSRIQSSQRHSYIYYDSDDDYDDYLMFDDYYDNW